MSPAALPNGGPWSAPVRDGVPEIAIDIVGSSDAEENTARQLDRLAEQPDDGFPVYTISLVNHSLRPGHVGWRVEGEGSHPVGPADLGTLQSGAARATRRLPSGIATVEGKGAAEISVWAIEDHHRDPGEEFRIVLSDAATGKPLVYRYRQQVIAHAQTREHFRPDDAGGDCRAEPIRG